MSRRPFQSSSLLHCWRAFEEALLCPSCHSSCTHLRLCPCSHIICAICFSRGFDEVQGTVTCVLCLKSFESMKVVRITPLNNLVDVLNRTPELRRRIEQSLTLADQQQRLEGQRAPHTTTYVHPPPPHGPPQTDPAETVQRDQPPPYSTEEADFSLLFPSQHSRERVDRTAAMSSEFVALPGWEVEEIRRRSSLSQLPRTETASASSAVPQNSHRSQYLPPQSEIPNTNFEQSGTSQEAPLGVTLPPGLGLGLPTLEHQNLDQQNLSSSSHVPQRNQAPPQYGPRKVLRKRAAAPGVGPQPFPHPPNSHSFSGPLQYRPVPIAPLQSGYGNDSAPSSSREGLPSRSNRTATPVQERKDGELQQRRQFVPPPRPLFPPPPNSFLGDAHPRPSAAAAVVAAAPATGFSASGRSAATQLSHPPGLWGQGQGGRSGIRTDDSAPTASVAAGVGAQEGIGEAAAPPSSSLYVMETVKGRGKRGKRSRKDEMIVGTSHQGTRTETERHGGHAGGGVKQLYDPVVGPPGCNLFICALPKWACGEDIKRLIRNCLGAEAEEAVLGVQVYRHSNGRSKSMGVIAMKSPRQVARTIRELSGKEMVMDPSDPRYSESAPPQSRNITIVPRKVDLEPLLSQLPAGSAEDIASLSLTKRDES